MKVRLTYASFEAGEEQTLELDPTGVCHWCGEECSNAFCRPECYRSYRGGEKQSDAGERQKP